MTTRLYEVAADVECDWSDGQPCCASVSTRQVPVRMSRVVESESAVTVRDWARRTWLTQWSPTTVVTGFTLSTFTPARIDSADGGGYESTCRLVDDCTGEDACADYDRACAVMAEQCEGWVS